MIARKTFLLVAVSVSYVSSTLPATLRTVDVSRNKDRYQVVADTHLDASPEAIYTVLLDHDRAAPSGVSRIHRAVLFGRAIVGEDQLTALFA
jgi:hypothetical protein